jgi:hypothetical protein
MGKKAIETTSAETKSIGFDYQYYYFLLQLLNLDEGETIGLEVKDDVHIDLPDGRLILLQLKHTLQSNATGDPINLKERDIDLWKTIHNWIAVICDPAEGRGSPMAQTDFVKNTMFVLVSNKGTSSRNTFLAKMHDLQASKISVKDLKDYLRELSRNTTTSDSNAQLLTYISELILLDRNVLEFFASKIEFKLEEDDLIQRIKKRIEWYFVPATQVEDVYHKLNSTLRDNNYFTVKSGNKIKIARTEFMRDYRQCFPTQTDLPVRRRSQILPADYMEQTFIKQLIDIGDTSIADTDDIILYTKLKLLMRNNLELWIQQGELSEEQKKVFVGNCVLKWKNLHKEKHRLNTLALKNGKTSQEIENDITTASISCVDEIRKIILSIEGQKLEQDISNGQFYLMSDEPIIGWHLEWKTKYPQK